jgi:hypothetical protein
MTAVELIVWGLVAHLVADWFFQNEWQALNKAKRRIEEPHVIGRPVLNSGPLYATLDLVRRSKWWDRHPAAYVHAGIHAVVQLLIFPVWAAVLIGFLHLLIDTRSPLDWWGKFTRQTRHEARTVVTSNPGIKATVPDMTDARRPLYDMGMEVAIWRDQTAHLVVLAAVACLVINV